MQMQEPTPEPVLTPDQAIEMAKGSCPVLAQFGRAALVKEGWTDEAIASAVGPIPRGLRSTLRRPSRDRIVPRTPVSPAARKSELPAPPAPTGSSSPRGMANMLARSMRPVAQPPSRSASQAAGSITGLSRHRGVAPRPSAPPDYPTPRQASPPDARRTSGVAVPLQCRQGEDPRVEPSSGGCPPRSVQPAIKTGLAGAFRAGRRVPQP